MNKEKRNVLLRHLGIWVFITIYLSIADPGRGPIVVQVISILLLMLNYVWVFYLLSLYILPRVNRKYLLIPIILFFLGATFVLTDYLIFHYIIPFLGGVDYYEGLPLKELLKNSALAFSMTVFPAFGYYFTRKNILETKIQAEREKTIMVKELSFLKNQFNSHITFNFLNYCYTKVYKHSEETAEAIEIFSKILRYTLELKPSEKVALVKELDYIKDFIGLQKVLTSRVYVVLDFSQDYQEKQIHPRLLITFVENAFKHGDFTNPNNPIVITLEANAHSITFTVKNKKAPNKNFISSGIGQENVRQLLEIYYLNNYELEYYDRDDNYITKLQLTC